MPAKKVSISQMAKVELELEGYVTADNRIEELIVTLNGLDVTDCFDHSELGDFEQVLLQEAEFVGGDDE